MSRKGDVFGIFTNADRWIDLRAGMGTLYKIGIVRWRSFECLNDHRDGPKAREMNDKSQELAHTKEEAEKGGFEDGITTK